MSHQGVGVGVHDMMLNADNITSHFENTGKNIQRGIHAHTLNHFNALRTQNRGNVQTPSVLEALILDLG